MLTMNCTGIRASGLQAGGGEKDGLQKPGGWIYTQTGTVVQYLVTTETRPRALFLINERLSESAPPRNHAARRCAPQLSIRSMPSILAGGAAGSLRALCARRTCPRPPCEQRS